MQPAHDCSDGDVEDLGDLLVRESLDVAEQDRYPELLGKRLDGLLDLDVGEAVEDLVLGAPRRRGRLQAAQAPVQVEAVDLVDVGLVGPALLGPIRVDEGIREDAVQPRLEVGALLESLEPPVRLQVGVLHQVLGVGGIAGHPQRGGVDRRHVLHGQLRELRLVRHEVTLPARRTVRPRAAVRGDDWA
jgi:hypothetical protein